MKKYIPSLSVFILGIAFISFGIATNKQQAKQETIIDYMTTEFINGDLLYPDYAISDTLIVTNADQLNEALYQISGTDGEIDSVCHLYAAPYTKLSGLQPINFEQIR